MTWRPNKSNNSEALEGKKIEENRANNLNRADDKVKNFSITLVDVDTAILDYMTKVINPIVSENGGDAVKVPIIYGSPERWKAIRKDGYIRDKKGKVQVPIIMFKRNTMTRNDSLITLNRYLSEPFVKKYSAKNNYDQFSILSGKSVPIKEIYNVTLPDHVVITYECMIWTDYVEQMNSIVEAINFTAEDYWGDKDKFKFRVSISDYTTQTEIPTDADRIVRSSFSMTVYAYLLPEERENRRLTTEKILTKRKLVINAEIISRPEEDTFHIRRSSDFGNVQITTFEGGNMDGIESGSDDTYVNKFLSTYITKSGSFLTGSDGFGNSVLNFSNSILLSTPSILSSTFSDVDKFDLFIDSVQVIKSAILPPTQSMSNLIVKVNNSTTNIVPNITSSISASGKFQ